VQVAQLVLALPVLERQVHEENAYVVELELDDEPLDAGIEVVEALAFDARRGEKGIALLAHDGHEVVDRALAVFALISAVVAQRFGDVLGLVQHAAANRSDVDLDEAHDVRILFLHETGDAIEHTAAGTQVSRARKRQMKSRSGAGGISNVVYEEAQAVDANVATHKCGVGAPLERLNYT
jgi:hypothetical protein